MKGCHGAKRLMSLLLLCTQEEEDEEDEDEGEGEEDGRHFSGDGSANHKKRNHSHRELTGTDRPPLRGSAFCAGEGKNLSPMKNSLRRQRSWQSDRDPTWSVWSGYVQKSRASSRKRPSDGQVKRGRHSSSSEPYEG